MLVDIAHAPSEMLITRPPEFFNHLIYSYGFRPNRSTYDAMTYLGKRLASKGGESYQWVIEPEKMSESQHHVHFEGETIALAKLLVKDGEKPDKFLRPHGMILRFDGFCILGLSQDRSRSLLAS